MPRPARISARIKTIRILRSGRGLQENQKTIPQIPRHHRNHSSVVQLPILTFTAVGLLVTVRLSILLPVEPRTSRTIGLSPPTKFLTLSLIKHVETPTSLQCHERL